MRTRKLAIASVSIGVMSLGLPWSEPALAQESEQQNVHVLPATTITAPKPKPKRRPEDTATRVAGPSTKLVVYATSPLSSADVSADKVPAATSVVGADQIQQAGSPIVTDALQKYV